MTTRSTPVTSPASPRARREPPSATARARRATPSPAARVRKFLDSSAVAASDRWHPLWHLRLCIAAAMPVPADSGWQSHIDVAACGTQGVKAAQLSPASSGLHVVSGSAHDWQRLPVLQAALASEQVQPSMLARLDVHAPHAHTLMATTTAAATWIAPTQARARSA